MNAYQAVNLCGVGKIEFVELYRSLHSVFFIVVCY